LVPLPPLSSGLAPQKMHSINAGKFYLVGIKYATRQEMNCKITLESPGRGDKKLEKLIKLKKLKKLN